MKIRVVGSAGCQNSFDEVLDGDYSNASSDDIWEDALHLAAEMTSFEFTVLVVLDDGTEMDPEEWIKAGKPN